jgi:SUKH-3 immunity protein
MFDFRDEVQGILRPSGWFPERSVDISGFTDRLLKEGYTFNAFSKRILRNLGGLKITPPQSDSNLFFPGELVFDPFYAASGELDRVKGWERKFKLNLSPLGEYDPLFLLLSADNGKMYGGRERKFYLLGDSIEDALELRLLANRLPILIKEDT